jgi:SPP1 gp7 family putative phage head morphogenesis protein
MPNDQAERIRAMEKVMANADAMLEAAQEEYIRALYAKWNEFQARLEADILFIQDKIFQGQDPNYALFQKFQGDKQISQAIADELKRLKQSVDESRITSLVNQYKDSYNATAWVLDGSTPPSLEINYAQPLELQMRQYVTEDWDNIFVTRNDREWYFLANELKTEVTRSMIMGDSVTELRNAIIDIIGDQESGYKYRAERIARTELLRAANIAREHIYKQNDDVIDEWVWITRALGDARLCDDCAERSGKTRDEVAEIAASQDMFVDPPAHPNCGCTWGVKLKSFKDILPPELAQGIEDFPDPKDIASALGDYNSWADENLQPSQRGNL